MKVTELHKIAKSRFEGLARLAEAAHGQRAELARNLRDLESHLLAGLLASAGTEFLNEHANRLHRPDGSPVPGFYEKFVKGLRHFLCLDFVALFGTTADEASPVLVYAASTGSAATVSAIRKVHLVCGRLSTGKPCTDAFGGVHVFPVRAQIAAFRGPGVSAIPQSGRVALLPAGNGVTAALLYDGDLPGWLPQTFSDNLIAQAVTIILLPQLYRLRMYEFLAEHFGRLRHLTHEANHYMSALSSCLRYLELIYRHTNEGEREIRKAKILADIRTYINRLVEVHRTFGSGGLEPEARLRLGRRSAPKRAERVSRKGPTT